MGTKLVTEVFDHSPKSLTDKERYFLVLIASHARDETRLAWPGRELLMQRMRTDTWDSVSKVLRSLARKGVEVRLPLSTDAAGRVTYAARGRQTTYRIPHFDRSSRVTDHSPNRSSQMTDHSRLISTERSEDSAPEGRQIRRQRLEDSADPTSQESSMGQAAAGVTAEVQQLAERYGVVTEVAQAMLALAEQDPRITHPLGHLRNPEWEKNQRLLAEAQERVRNAATAEERASTDAEAAEVLGPRPPEGSADRSHRWRIAAAAFRKRHQNPGRWQQELADWRRDYP